MSVQVERLEHNEAKLTITVEAKEFDAACKRAYNKSKGQFNLPGFRKGKVPMNVIEKTYGAGVFYEDAANELINEFYPASVKDIEEKIVSTPEIDVVEIGKGKDFVFTATAAVKPEVTLGQYKGLEIEKDPIEATEEEIQAELQKAAEKNAREYEVTDRAVIEGDKITLNYAGTIDGVAFDGGTATNQQLEIGSNSFIDTFEDQLVGMNIGEEKDVQVTFPEQYHAADLAGKPATFHVKVLGITAKELPEINDDFAQDTTEFDSLEEYKADIKAKIEADKDKMAISKMENELIERVWEASEMDIPEKMIDTQVENMINEYSQTMSYQGISFEQYLQFTGQNLDAMKESIRPEALKRIKGQLVLEAIIDAENIEASDEDVHKELERMAAQYQMDVEQLAGYMPEEELKPLKENLAIQKAVDFVLENAVIK